MVNFGCCWATNKHLNKHRDMIVVAYHALLPLRFHCTLIREGYQLCNYRIESLGPAARYVEGPTNREPPWLKCVL